ncbi:GAF domain-containing sensor histidine kinase [Leptolyngbya sp. CCNP1308]|uniref:GAF domain-containing sensor histidine kinase n=1 Tax=Leptolyngbya sp. CCNP1308 TaxID=3110255 RepID=UPI002B212334|nr:GAF domain-containing sensor histidine kinase [Leptolyngbya sp. CCNP1308]MEA5452288.1 GAF domain-containing sensor histidine kinase [Leptolyngbya sp. CCNP1308]
MSVSVFPVGPEGKAADETTLPQLTWPCCSLQGLTWVERQQRRNRAIAALDLSPDSSIPAWEEAAQMAARFLGVPIAVVTLADSQTEYVRAAFGLSCLGVGNPLSQQRQIPLQEGFGVYILDSEQALQVTDTLDSPSLAQSDLVITYGIRAYAGVPLMTGQGICVGTLAAIDVQPRPFTAQDLGFLAMAARWGMSEYERQQATCMAPAPQIPLESLVDRVRLNLISQLTQELRSPLTTVLGMTTMLSREIYGPLTPKQREYTDIVHRSSQTLMALVEELIDLNPLETERSELVPTAVDIEALGQQVLATLTPVAEASAQTLSLSVEPGENHWILDQRVVKQILYHLAFSIMQVAGDNGTLRVHACRRGKTLALALWLSNPWLGEGLPQEVVTLLQASTVPRQTPRSLLGILLGQHLVRRHGGQMTVQGSIDSDCRLLVILPGLEAATARAESSHPQVEIEATCHR